MRITHVLRTAALAVVLAALPVAAGAQADITSPYEFIEQNQEAGVFLGHASMDAGRFGFGPSGGPLVGARWGIELSGPISFETEAGLMAGSRDVINPARAEGDRKIAEADAHIANVDARLKFTFTGARTWHGLAPFLVAGGGLAFDLAGEDPADLELEPADRFDFGTSFHGTVGLGSRWFVSEGITLRGDGVFGLWKLSTPPGFSDPERGFDQVEESEWATGFRLTVAALVRF